jgi:hypothetical protein
MQVDKSLTKKHWEIAPEGHIIGQGKIVPKASSMQQQLMSRHDYGVEDNLGVWIPVQSF